MFVIDSDSENKHEEDYVKTVNSVLNAFTLLNKKVLYLNQILTPTLYSTLFFNYFRL